MVDVKKITEKAMGEFGEAGIEYCEIVESISAVEVEIEAIRMQGSLIIGVYWDWFSNMNKIKLTLKKQGVDTRPARLAPHHRIHSANHKVYFMWSTWGRSSGAIAQIKDKQHSKQIKEGSRGYPDAILTRHCEEWQVDMVLATEQKLSPLRHAVNVKHEYLVKLKKLTKKHLTQPSQEEL
jgi:hypothetical protein